MKKQLYIPANPLLASILKDILERLSCTAFQRFTNYNRKPLWISIYSKILAQCGLYGIIIFQKSWNIFCV